MNTEKAISLTMNESEARGMILHFKFVEEKLWPKGVTFVMPDRAEIIQLRNTLDKIVELRGVIEGAVNEKPLPVVK